MVDSNYIKSGKQSYFYMAQWKKSLVANQQTWQVAQTGA